MVDNELPGIPEMIFDTIAESPMDCRAQLYNNIVLSGGSTMFPGYPTRITKDLWSIFKRKVLKGSNHQTKIKINVIDSFRRKHSVFTGGSVLCKLSGLNWITKAQYEEEGDK